MPRKNTASSHQASSRSLDPGDALAQLYLSEDKEDRRSLRFSLALALVAHLLILFAAIPELQSKEIEPAEAKKVIRLAPTPKYRQPPPPPPEQPKPRQKIREIPMPDPDPDHDVYVLEEPEPQEDLELDEEPFLPLPGPPPQAEPAVTGPVRVGGKVSSPTRTHYVAPRYPEMARRARIEGTVILEATIDVEGRVVDLQVLKGRPFGLSEAAVEAASQWRFEPSTLGGKSVPVLYVVTVQFNLQ